MFWNPWSEVRALRAELERAEAAILRERLEADRIIETLKADNRELSIKFRAADMQAGIYAMQMKSMHRRDPKTGRILPRGK